MGILKMLGLEKRKIYLQAVEAHDSARRAHAADNWDHDETIRHLENRILQLEALNTHQEQQLDQMKKQAFRAMLFEQSKYAMEVIYESHDHIDLFPGLIDGADMAKAKMLRAFEEKLKDLIIWEDTTNKNGDKVLLGCLPYFATENARLEFRPYTDEYAFRP